MTDPARDAASLPGTTGSAYPAPFDAPCAARVRRALGDVFGLNDFGVNLLELPPGAWSSQRHWHSHEDEFVYVLEGNPTLVTDAGRRRLAPGMVAGFPAGRADGHHLVNETDRPVRLLEVGDRKPAVDDTDYPDIDMRYDSAAGGYLRRDGTAY